MSDDISAGVKILLERGKTDPDEMLEGYGKWSHLRDAVFEYKESGRRSSWLRGLTEHEIDLLFGMFNTNYRDVFDSWVMKSVLGADEDENEAEVQRKMAHSMAMNNLPIINPSVFQNTTQPGGIYATSVTSVTSSTTTTPGLLARGKKALGIK